MLNGKTYWGNDGTISVRYLIQGDIIYIHNTKITIKGIYIDEDTQIATITGNGITAEGKITSIETPVGLNLRLKVGKNSFEPSNSVTTYFNSLRYCLGTNRIKDIDRRVFRHLVDMEETLYYLGKSIEDDGGAYEDKIYSFTYDEGLYTFLTQYADYSGGTIDRDVAEKWSE